MQMTSNSYLKSHASILLLGNDASDSSLQYNDVMKSLSIALLQHECPTVSLHRHTAHDEPQRTHAAATYLTFATDHQTAPTNYTIHQFSTIDYWHQNAHTNAPSFTSLAENQQRTGASGWLPTVRLCALSILQCFATICWVTEGHLAGKTSVTLLSPTVLFHSRQRNKTNTGSPRKRPSKQR